MVVRKVRREHLLHANRTLTQGLKERRGFRGGRNLEEGRGVCICVYEVVAETHDGKLRRGPLGGDAGAVDH